MLYVMLENIYLNVYKIKLDYCFNEENILGYLKNDSMHVSNVRAIITVAV